ncbi:MAG TPA: PepSY-associated TM helix domain-containing protein [Puia sp.]|nr:PepSY-associated TM helix domain-containing protein [Puia sp.]
MKKKKTIKYWIGRLHLWLGLASGIIVLIVSITGCLFVFQKEISETIWREKYFVIPPEVPVQQPLSRLQETAQAVLGPDKPINDITTYHDPGRSWEFMAYNINDTALSYFGSVAYYQSVFINPYTGQVTGTRDYKYDFFSIVKSIHWSLLLNTKYGQPIVGWSTLIFVLMLITGLVLWWPKKWTKAMRNRSFKIKWKAGFKRVNYDLHNVPGFYTLIPALIISMTGLVWAFTWFEDMVYGAAAGTTTRPALVNVKSVDSARTNEDLMSFQHPMSIAFGEALHQLPAAQRLLMIPPAGKGGIIYAYGYKDDETYYGSDALQFDGYSGRLLYRRNNSEKNRGEKLIEMNYDIHVGAIGGLTGKIIAFIAALICASLPVTGFIIWWGRKHKKRTFPRSRSTISSAVLQTQI